MLPLTRSRNRSRFFGAPFSPASLFVGGTVAGAWYDPSDLSTLFTTSAGTTQCAMPGQGSAVSVGLMLDKSQGLVLGANLTDPLNFAAPLWTVGANVTNITANSFETTGPATGLNSTTLLQPNKWYQITMTYTKSNTAAFSVRFDATNDVVSFTATSGTVTGIGFSSATDNIYFRAASPTTITITSISIRELPGNHAIAFNNTTARPELRARVNLLVATATLSTQSVTTQATSYTLRFAGTGSITLSGTATGSYSAGTHTITCTAGTLTLTVSGTVTTADLRPANSGALLPAYQAVVDANTYDTSGFPLYLRFDGIDDSMYTPANLNLSGTDKVAVFAGVRKLSAALGFFAELSANTSANNGSFYVVANNGTNDYGISLRGTAQATYQPVTYTAPISNVLAVSYDIAGAAISDEIVPRVNGVVEQDNPSGANAGTGNFGTYPLYIGARNNASGWLNGHLHSLIIAGSAVSAGNISATEQWVAGKTGIQI